MNVTIILYLNDQIMEAADSLCDISTIHQYMLKQDKQIIAGLIALALSLFLPRSEDFLVFLMPLGWLGFFAIVFNKASLTPSILLAIYGFSIGFPIVMDLLVGEAAATANTNVVMVIFNIFGLPITHEGTILAFNSANGDAIRTAIITACAGYATLGVFLALFALMMLGGISGCPYEEPGMSSCSVSSVFGCRT